MVSSLDAATQTAVRDRSILIPRNFVLVTVKAIGDPATTTRFGFTDYGEDVTLNIVDGETGSTVSRDYFGDNQPILKMDPMPLKIGLEVDTTQVVLSQIDEHVQSMARGYDIRNANVQIHRGYLDPDSHLLVAAPRIRRLGQINGAPIMTPAAGGEGSITLKIVSHTRELTRINTAKRSDETQRRRGTGDRFRRYGGTAGKWEIFWGESQASEDNANTTSQPGGHRR